MDIAVTTRWLIRVLKRGIKQQPQQVGMATKVVTDVSKELTRTLYFPKILVKQYVIGLSTL